MEKKRESCIQALGFRDILPNVENQMEKKMEREMETGLIQGLKDFTIFGEAPAV